MSNKRRANFNFAPKSSAGASKMALPSAKVRAKSIGGSNLGDLNQGISLPKAITFVLDNSADVAAKTHLLFDAYGIIASLTGKSYDADQLTTKKLTKAIVNEFMKSHAIVFSGMRMEAKVSSIQFANDIIFMQGGLDGTLKQNNVQLNDAVSGETYNPKIQYYNAEFTLDGTKGIEIPIDKGETLTVTLYVKGISNVL